MEQNKKGSRTKNFTESEKMLLIELVRERQKILENKTTNAVSVKEKEDCWEDLRLNFMSRSNGVSRCIQSLKTCWENIKKRTKKQYAKEKQAIYKTGGGQYKAGDPIAELVREIIRPSVEGLSNVFDNDCIEVSQNSFDKNEEFVEEWLDSNENIIEVGEDDIEEDEDDKRVDADDTKDCSEFDMEEPVLNSLQKDKLSWRNWNPQKLKTQISAPLRTSAANKRKSAPVDHSANSEKKKSKVNDSIPLILKETAKKTSNVLKQKNNSNSNNKLEKFSTLADNKMELINLTMDNGKEKHEFEIKIIQMQLQKEKLQVEIMQKELELKTFILEKEQRKFNVLRT